VAFRPNLANVQVVSKSARIGARGAVIPAGLLYFPRQFGPRNSESEDIFEKETRSRFASAVFVDNWDMYHRRNGGVHCGTVTIRDLPRRWWARQP